MRFCILIPAYNEEKKIEKTLRKVMEYVPPEDILVVDDGSRDRTREIAEKLGVNVVSHEKNMGKGMAHRTGFRWVCGHGYDAAITMDADGQHKPEELERFLHAGEYDLVIGKRDITIRNSPVVRYWTNRTTSLITSLLAGVRVSDSQCGYRLIKKAVMEKVPLTTTRFQTETEIIVKAARMGFRIGEVPISTVYEPGRKSRINPFIDTLRFLKLAIRLLLL
ncbi:glycosyltransferase family 2 protein [bacterium]|nr:MAG: glycosyltransferase family 2 protein [bacterium]